MKKITKLINETATKCKKYNEGNLYETELRKSQTEYDFNRVLRNHNSDKMQRSIESIDNPTPGKIRRKMIEF